MDNESYNNEYVSRYINAYVDLYSRIKTNYIPEEIAHFSGIFEKYADKYGILRKENRFDFFKLQERVIDSLVKAFDDQVDKWASQVKEINEKIFKVINSDNPNKMLEVSSYMRDISNMNVISSLQAMDFIDYIGKEVDGILRPYENLIEKDKLSEMKKGFSKEVIDEYEKIFRDIQVKSERDKNEFVATQKSIINKHLEDENKDKNEVVNESSTNISNNEEYSKEINNIENKQDKEMFGLSTDEVIIKTSNFFSVLGLTLQKDDNGKVHVYNGENKEALTDYIYGEDYDTLLMNFEDKTKYSFNILGDNKDIIKIKSDNFIMKYNSTNYTYDISNDLFDYVIDINNNKITKSDVNSLTLESIEITYEELKDDLDKLNINVSKIEGLNKDIGQR